MEGHIFTMAQKLWLQQSFFFHPSVVVGALLNITDLVDETLDLIFSVCRA